MEHRNYSECDEVAISLYWRSLGSARGMRHVDNGIYEYVLSGDREGPERIFNIKNRNF